MQITGSSEHPQEPSELISLEKMGQSINRLKEKKNKTQNQNDCLYGDPSTQK